MKLKILLRRRIGKLILLVELYLFLILLLTSAIIQIIVRATITQTTSLSSELQRMEQGKLFVYNIELGLKLQINKP